MRFTFVVMLASLVLLAACGQSTHSVDMQMKGDMKIFQDACIAQGHMWHRMNPTVNGTAVEGASSCFGCMVGGTHYCSFEEYAKATGLDQA